MSVSFFPLRASSVWFSTLGFVVAVGGVACAGPKPPEAPKPDDSAVAKQPSGGARKKSGPSVQSEIGGLDEKATMRAFESWSRKVETCQDARRGKNPNLDFLAGSLTIKVHIDEGGRSTQAHLVKSTLGDEALEACIVAAANAMSWPKPEGGKMGLAEQEITLPMKGDRDAVAWSADKLGKELEQLRPKLKECRAGKSGAYDVTMYVGTEGEVLAAGASSPEADGGKAAACLTKLVAGTKWPSPGGFPAKVTFAVP
jgi:hypothetical protein